MFKKLFEKEKKLLDNVFSTEKGIRIISIIIAVFLFVVVSEKPTLWGNTLSKTTYLEEIPLKLKYNEDDYVVYGLPSTITVKVTGDSSTIDTATLRSKSLTAEVAIPTTREGEVTIKGSDLQFYGIGIGKFESITPEYVVTVEKKVKESFPINITYLNGNDVKSSYTLETPVLSEHSVEVIGGSKTIKTVSSVNALVDLSQLTDAINKDDSTFQTTAPLVAYDKNGDKVNKVDFLINEIDVRQNYQLTTVTKPVRYTFANNQTEKYVNSICKTTKLDECFNKSNVRNEEEYVEMVEVYGDVEKINEIEAIEYNVDLKNFNNDNAQYVAQAILPTNIYSTESSFKVIVSMESGTSKEIKNIPIRQANLTSNLTVKAETRDEASLSAVVNGSKDVVNDFTVDDIALFVDLSEINRPGTYTLPVTYDVDKYVDVTLEKEIITIVVTEV